MATRELDGRSIEAMSEEKTYTIGSLFAGIGGFDLGFERAGFKTAWQVEIDPYCQKVLAKNFPEAERFGDIRECGSHNLKPVDVICGGFPCQDISNAGLRAGITGERSGLWGQMVRAIRLVRPKFALVENVAALLGRGMDVVLGDLSEIWHDAEWDCISAADVGAPHLRERIWILAYAEQAQWGEIASPCGGMARENAISQGEESSSGPESCREVLANSPRIQSRWSISWSIRKRTWARRKSLVAGSDANGEGLAITRHARGTSETSSGIEQGATIDRSSWWIVEPNVGRVAHGVPKRVDRLRGLGNAVVPQIPEMIARRIKQALDSSVCT